MNLFKKILKTNKQRVIYQPRKTTKRDIEIEAYFLAKSDNNTKSPNFYWYEAEKKLNQE